MNKLLIITLGILFLIGIVSAGIGDVISKQITIDKDKLDTIKSATNTKGDLKIQTSEIICDSKFCKSNIYLKDGINTEWIIEKAYCTERNIKTEKICNTFVDYLNCDGEICPNKTECADVETDLGCKTMTEYTINELQNMRDDYAKKRLNDYGVKLQETKTTTVAVNKGELIVK